MLTRQEFSTRIASIEEDSRVGEDCLEGLSDGTGYIDRSNPENLGKSIAQRRDFGNVASQVVAIAIEEVERVGHGLKIEDELRGLKAGFAERIESVLTIVIRWLIIPKLLCYIGELVLEVGA